MKVGFSFYGIIYGPGGRTGSDRDFRHCWPNQKRTLIDPLLEQGHEANIYFSGYPINDGEIEKQFYDLVKPTKVLYNEFVGSTPFTCRKSAYNNFIDDELDVIVFTRSDIHFHHKITDLNVDYDKFNFLFYENCNHQNFTTDNFYVWPHRMTKMVQKAFYDTHKRFTNNDDTHGLMNELLKYIDPSEINVISPDIKQFSDVNSFYSLCRTGLPTPEERGCDIHPEVQERFYK